MVRESVDKQQQLLQDLSLLDQATALAPLPRREHQVIVEALRRLQGFINSCFPLVESEADDAVS